MRSQQVILQLIRAVTVFVALAGTMESVGGQGVELRVDFTRTNGIIRPLHGINKGPLAAGGTIDLTGPLRDLGAPLTRLHDCQWPYPEVVDIHAIFRDFKADPSIPAGYDWALTDAYLAAVRDTGARIVYRLGESIEHATVKRFVHPPADPERWAAVCVGIARHYNQGWANGTNHQIQYWEIWNEPENRPAMWTGTDEDYYRLYRTAARALKKHEPSLKVGGPSVGYSGAFSDGRFIASEFVTNFLAICRKDSVPLDFFSWHCYTADPSELAARSKAVRRLLDDYGLTATENHLNEWNYLPGNTWEPFSKSAAPEIRRKFYREMAGPVGAAFTATALIELQDAPLDVSNFYHGEIGPFGLFDEFGVPNHTFYAIRAFSKLAAAHTRVFTEGGLPGKLAALAARSQQDSGKLILISNFQGQHSDLTLQIKNVSESSRYTLSVVDAHNPWREASRGQLGPSGVLKFHFPAPSVALIELAD